MVQQDFTPGNELFSTLLEIYLCLAIDLSDFIHNILFSDKRSFMEMHKYFNIWSQIGEKTSIDSEGRGVPWRMAIDVLTFVSGNKRDHYAKRKSVVSGLQRVFWTLWFWN